MLFSALGFLLGFDALRMIVISFSVILYNSGQSALCNSNGCQVPLQPVSHQQQPWGGQKHHQHHCLHYCEWRHTDFISVEEVGQKSHFCLNITILLLKSVFDQFVNFFFVLLLMPCIPFLPSTLFPHGVCLSICHLTFNQTVQGLWNIGESWGTDKFLLSKTTL